MDTQLIKLAYRLGYKSAQEESAPLFDPRTGKVLPNFDENFSVQEAADNPWVLGAAGAGSAYMAGRSLFHNPVKALEKQRANYIAGLQKTTGVRGAYNRVMNKVNPGRVDLLNNRRVVGLTKKINAAKLSKPSVLRRIGKGGLWGTAAAMALGALAYRNDLI
jgi:hypothetical protein